MWRIETTKNFDKQLRKIPPEAARRLFKLFAALEVIDDPRSRGKALTGPLKGFWRYRFGDYRVVCEIQDERLVVLAIIVGHRSRIYE